MIEKLKVVLDKFLIDKYPEIHHIEVTTNSMRNIFRVIFMVNNKIENSLSYEMMDEATGLFQMLGPNLGEEIVIGFELYKSGPRV